MNIPDYHGKAIYKLINLNNGKFYIGSSDELDSRIKQHFYRLTRGIHNNAGLQSDFNNGHKFKAEVLKKLDSDVDKYTRLAIERETIIKTKAIEIGYNLQLPDPEQYRHSQTSLKFKIKVVLADREMTQKELAEKTGIRPPTISALCTGQAKHIPVSALLKICESLQCQPGDLLEWVDD